MTVSCADVVTAYKTRSQARAADVESALDADGIPCFLEGVSRVGWTGLTINVQVPVRHADRAAKLLRSSACVGAEDS
jgi:hypothetical protein